MANADKAKGTACGEGRPSGCEKMARGTAAETVSLKMAVKSGSNLRNVSMHALIVGQMAAGGKLN